SNAATWPRTPDVARIPLGEFMIGTKARRIIRQAAKAVGIEIHQDDKTPWEWSCSVEEYYPVSPAARWGYGNPAHPQILEKLKQQRSEISAVLSNFACCRGILDQVPADGDPNSTMPFWNNDWFPYFDAASLIMMLVTNAPARYFEIGSGASTKFARYTVKKAGLSTKITSIDPQPRAEIDPLCDTVIRKRLEDCDLTIFDPLSAGDILFFDGSHRAFPNSDVTVFFLELIPRLKPGVIVHLHDIFLPWDYLPEWNKRMYSEQYLLAAMLLCPTQPFKVLLPNFFIYQDPELITKVPPLVSGLGGGSFWLEIK